MKIDIVKQMNTEKTHKLEEANVYTFLFPFLTRKDVIKKIVEKKYSVKVDGVNIVNMNRKKRGFRGTKGLSSKYKKAYVKVAKGMKIATDSVSNDKVA